MDSKIYNGIIIIVDAYSSGNDLAPGFINNGYECAHIQSRENIPDKLLSTFREDDFFYNGIYTGDDVLNEISKDKIKAVIAGSETGIELADYLSFKLNLEGNNPKTSVVRRNKYLMQDCLEKKGLNHITTYRLNSADDAVEYATELLKYNDKLVLKPIDSAGTDSVFICSTVNEVESKSLEIFKKNNQLNLKNEVIILQPFIEGTEYVVDTVSYRGHHKICAIWKMGKGSYNGADSVCEFTELTSFDEYHHKVLQEYIFSCLDAMGIEFGAAHSELFLTDVGWKLIETGARPHGAGFPALSSLALKNTQIDELVSAICSGNKFLESISNEYKPVSSLKIKELISYVSGTVKSLNFIDKISRLPSYKKSHFPQVNETVKLTTDVYTSPGWIALSHSCAEQVDTDYNDIVSLEREGLFDIYE